MGSRVKEEVMANVTGTSPMSHYAALGLRQVEGEKKEKKIQIYSFILISYIVRWWKLGCPEAFFGQYWVNTVSTYYPIYTKILDIPITLFFLVRDLIDFQGRLPGAAITTSIFAILSVFPFVILSPNLFVFLIFPIF